MPTELLKTIPTPVDATDFDEPEEGGVRHSEPTSGQHFPPRQTPA
jgi:hypothetical protein